MHAVYFYLACFTAARVIGRSSAVESFILDFNKTAHSRFLVLHLYFYISLYFMFIRDIIALDYNHRNK